LFSLGRHFYITVIISIQYPKFILNSVIRNNIDYLFFSELNKKAIEAIYDTVYIDMNIKQFSKFLNDNNNDYQFIFYDNKIKEKD